MRNGQRGLRESSHRRRSAYAPRTEMLEDRRLLTTTISVANADTAPFGVLLTGSTINGGAGYSVAEVGDTNGDGFDDFLVSAPTVSNTGNGPGLGAGEGSQVYLIFGSVQVGNPSVIFDYLNLNTLDFADTTTGSQRIGSLGSLGNPIQTNPLPAAGGIQGFPFAGIQFRADNTPNSALGASVAGVGDVNGDGLADFLMGAPGANALSGRAYLIYGSTTFSTLNPGTTAINLDAPPQGFLFATFTSVLPGAQAGLAVGSAGDVIADAKLDIAIGAPLASVNGLQQNGAVYVISGAFFGTNPANPPTGTFDLGTVSVNSTTLPGVVFSGEATGANAGFSLASVGNVSGVPLPGLSRSDFLIGAPHLTSANAPGGAYLIYGQTPGGFGVTPFVDLTQVGLTIDGAHFTGDANTDRTGYSVSSGGDFNADGFADIMIGSPGFASSAGRVNLVLGGPTTAFPGPIEGPDINLTSLLTGADQIGMIEFLGDQVGGFFGYSLTALGSINNDTISEIAIGQPGFLNNLGQAYIIPGNTGLLAASFVVSSTAVSPNLFNLIIQADPEFGLTQFFGSSLSSTLFPNSAGRTVDGDSASDLIIGAPFASVNPAALPVAGISYALEGALLGLETPDDGPIPPPIPPPTPVEVTGFVSVRTVAIGPALPYGERLVPSNNILRRMRYKPLRPFTAHRQFLPTGGFAFRFNNYFHPKKHSNKEVTAYPTSKQRQNSGKGVYTLGRRVFSRGRFPNGLFIGKIKHEGPTIP